MIRMIQKNMNKKGFTLVELIIVIAVMAILAAIVVPRMAGITEAFSERADVRSMETIAKEFSVGIQVGVIKVAGTGVAATGNLISATATDVSTILTTITETPKNKNGGTFQASYASGTLTISLSVANANVPNEVLTNVILVE